MTKIIRRPETVHVLDEIQSGEMELANGTSQFVFPCDSNHLTLLIEFKPEVLAMSKDTISTSKTADGYEVRYSIFSKKRVAKWRLVKLRK